MRGMAPDKLVGNAANEFADTLEQVTTCDGGWTVLFRHPVDASLWRLSYPNSGYHGGGSPLLERIAADEAASQFAEYQPPA